jgi:hypothetical protein
MTLPGLTRRAVRRRRGSASAGRSPFQQHGGRRSRLQVIADDDDAVVDQEDRGRIGEFGGDGVAEVVGQDQISGLVEARNVGGTK